MMRRPPRSTRTDTLFPYPTLFRSVRIISDEIYHRLSYGAETHSMLQYDPDAFVINSFSKYYGMPGWRLGWIVCPPDLVAEPPARLGNLFLSPPALRTHAPLPASDRQAQPHPPAPMSRPNPNT